MGLADLVYMFDTVSKSGINRRSLVSGDGYRRLQSS